MENVPPLPHAPEEASHCGEKREVSSDNRQLKAIGFHESTAQLTRQRCPPHVYESIKITRGIDPTHLISLWHPVATRWVTTTLRVLYNEYLTYDSLVLSQRPAGMCPILYA